MSEHLINQPPKPSFEDFNAALQRQAREAAIKAQMARPMPAPLPKPVISPIKQHENQESAMEYVQEAFKKAQESGKWMVAVWSVEDGKLKMHTRTTWQFPSGDGPIAVRHLQESIRAEQSLPVDEPLPQAELPPLPNAVGISAPPVIAPSKPIPVE